jgi:hypothetical protein
MSIAMVAVVVAMGLAVATGSTQAQEGEIDCDAFTKNPDGSWVAVRGVDVPGPGRSIRIRTGSVLRPGAVILGTDVAEMLEQKCRSVAVTAPDAPPPADLAKLADTSGNIDIQKLTCGQLTNVYQEDADFLLAWYSGWSNGLVKNSAINMPKLKDGIHNVIVHCKANREKLVSQAIAFVVKQDRR